MTNAGTILITSPSLNTEENVSGISSVTNFIIGNNGLQHYRHFELGRKDNEKRNLSWFFRLLGKTTGWMYILAFKKIKLVHFNLALSKASIIRDAPLLFFAKTIRKKLVIHLHGGDYLTKKQVPAWIKGILKKIFSGKTQVIVLSSMEAALIEKRYNAKNVKILPNCVDIKEADGFVRGHDANAMMNILFIGRITVEKGLDHIAGALHSLQQQQVPFKFFMAGTGPDEKLYVEKFTQMLGNRFEFKGIVWGNDKANLYKLCNIFLLPSLFEGLPMSLLESMLFGMVPIVTPVGSIKDVVTDGKNGVIVNEQPAKEITDAIILLVNDKVLMQQLSNNAAAYIKQHYNPEKYIGKLNAIYDAA